MKNEICKSDNSLKSKGPLRLQETHTPNFKKCLVGISNTLKSLEANLLHSNENDRMLFMALQRNNLKHLKISHRLDEARNENKLLLSALQIDKDDFNASELRNRSDYSSTCSTISMVHLQYKYEELLSSHEGLLKVLETKVKDSRKSYREIEELKDEMQKMRLQISDNEKTISTLCEKYLKLKQRKDEKVSYLKYKIDSLRLAHSQLVNLLNKNCLADDSKNTNDLEMSRHSEYSLIIQEEQLREELKQENLQLLRENKTLITEIQNLKMLHRLK